MVNVAYIYQPHFKTQKFRVAKSNQQGIDYDFIVVTCSPAYNGVWKYPSSNKNRYSVWNNGRKPCYEVPIEDCEMIKELKDIQNCDIIKVIKEMQNKWYENEVRNRNYEYSEKPEWIL